MSPFLKSVADLCGVGEAAMLQRMPGGLALDRPGEGFPAGPLKSAILCTPRSGSSLLSVALEAYGFDFQEYLNRNGALWQIVDGAGVESMSELAPHFVERANVGDRISIKMPWQGLPLMFAMGEFPKNIHQWRFVYVRRGNLVRQAISGFIAQRTGQWSSDMERKGEVSDKDYSFDDLLKLVGNYAQGNRIIERFIGLLGISAYSVVYEDFLEDQKGTLAEIAEFLGCDVNDYPDAGNHEPWLERQATELNEIWERRFRADLLDGLNAAEVAQSASSRA